MQHQKSKWLPSGKPLCIYVVVFIYTNPRQAKMLYWGMAVLWSHVTSPTLSALVCGKESRQDICLSSKSFIALALFGVRGIKLFASSFVLNKEQVALQKHTQTLFTFYSDDVKINEDCLYFVEDTLNIVLN